LWAGQEFASGVVGEVLPDGADVPGVLFASGDRVNDPGWCGRLSAMFAATVDAIWVVIGLLVVILLFLVLRRR
jgi:hypothetical protein